MKCGNLVVELNTRFVDLPERCERFIARPTNPPPAVVAVNNPDSDGPAIEQQNGNGVFFE